MLYPLTFRPIFKERVWGGRSLDRLYRKPLPAGQRIGESWEISDRPGDVSVIDNGPLAGKDLHWLVMHHRSELLGAVRLQRGRFPLLLKLLDARRKLSLQVHPPAAKARRLGGEPKTEMWYVADAAPGARLYVGLRRGVTRAEFERKISIGEVAGCFHQLPVRSGDAMFLPSGRVHAIGAGLVLFEIQQNSDTTYRVFDWNRRGLDGRPRELHVAQALASLDFKDFEPGLVRSRVQRLSQGSRQRLVTHPLFIVDLMAPRARRRVVWRGGRMRVIAVVGGSLHVFDPRSKISLVLRAGEFGLLPAGLKRVELRATPATRLLRVTAG